MPEISCVMPTYRRMNCVERSMSLFCGQDFKDSELIVYNTDEENPVILSEDFEKEQIIVVNNNIDFKTKKPYNNIGAIRRDALSFASGSYYICWDDDDIFLPWNNRQCFDNILNQDFWAWKPKSSMAKIGRRPEISQNVMEASIISRLDKVREFGYEEHLGGGEHMKWLKAFEKLKKIKVDENSIPAYSFNWSDERDIAGHKNSGTINNPDNFNIHREGCKDKHTKKLRKIDISGYISEYVELLRDNLGKTVNDHRINEYYFNKYIKGYL